MTTQAEAQQPSARDGGPYSIRLDLPEFYDNGSFDAAMAWLRSNDPVHWQETAGFWVVSTHADLRWARWRRTGTSSTTAYGIDVGVHLSRPLSGRKPGAWTSRHQRRGRCRRSPSSGAISPYCVAPTRSWSSWS